MSLTDKSRGSLVSVEKLGSHSALKLRIAQRVARIPNDIVRVAGGVVTDLKRA